VTLYLDSSSIAKRYVEEADSDRAESILLSDTSWVTANHTYVEVCLALHRRLGEEEERIALEGFERDWRRVLAVALDDAVCRRAAVFGTLTGARTLDALHLAAAERAGARSVPIVTFDLRLAQSARSLGFTVIGI